MPLPSKHLRFSLLSVLGLILVVGSLLLVSLFFQRPASQTPAAFFPADETAMVIAGGNAAELLSQTTWLTSPVPPPQVQNGSWLALVRMGDAWGWIAAEPVSEGRWNVRTSGPEVEALTKERSPKLSRIGAFRRLSALMPQNEPWIYMPTDERARANVSPLLRDLLSTYEVEALAFHQGTGKWTVAIDTKNMLRAAPIMRSVKLPFAPFFLLSTAHVRTLLSGIQRALPKEGAQIIEALLRNIAEEHAGKDVSLRFDLAPLAEGPTLLAWAEHPSGERFSSYVEGNANDAADLQARLEDLQSRLGGGSTNPIVSDYRFSEGFSTRIVREGSAASKAPERIGGWDVFTVSATTRNLTIATRDGTFRASDDTELLMNTLHAEPSQAEIVFPSARQTQPGLLIAGGAVDALWLSSLSPTLPDPLPLFLTPWTKNAKGLLVWSLEQFNGSTYVLRVEEK